MPVEDASQVIQVRFNKKYSWYFDEFVNCDLSNRKSDSGLIEVDRPMLRPRRGTVRVGNALVTNWSSATAYVVGDVVVLAGIMYRCKSGHTNQTPPNATYWDVFTGWSSKLFFYTDRQGQRRAYRAFNNNLYYLNGATWTSLWALGTTDVEFSTQRVPMLNILPWSSTTAYVIGDRVSLAGVIYNCILGHTNQTPPNVTYWAVSSTDPTQYTVAAVSSGAEKIKKAAGDTLNANNNVGKILMITNGVYKGCYASIIAYDTAWAEYTLGGSWAITAPPATTTYKLFDFVSDALCICRGSSSQNETFYDGIMPLSHFDGYVTESLRQVAALTPTQTVAKLVGFNNQVWTFVWSVLYYTGGFPWNPFFFNFTTSLSTGSNGAILDIFQYKTRLVTVGTNFIFSVPSTLIIDRHVTSFWGRKDAYINTGEDVYLLTNQGDLISLNETINGVVWVNTTVGQEVTNYTNTFRANFAFGFDGRRLYMYGETIAWVQGTMCVLDTLYKFWSVYTGMSPKSIVMEQGTLYMSDNNSDIVRSFSSLVVTDVALWGSNTTTFNQYFELKEVDLNDIFTGKTLQDIYLLFENYTQSVTVDTYIAMNFINAKRLRKDFDIAEVPLDGGTLGESNIGSSQFWSSWMLGIISVPIMKHIQYAADPVNIFKIRISWKNGSVFYMSQMDLKIASMPPKEYFDPSNTQ